MKHEIDSAIKTVSRTFSDDYQFYLSVLFGNEEIEERNEIKEAVTVLNKYGVPISDAKKHHERQKNKPDEPVPFINRPHFVAVETDELPF